MFCFIFFQALCTWIPLPEIYQVDVPMQQTLIEKSEIKLVGLKVRTSYAQELDPSLSQISFCVMKYFHESWSEQIPHRAKPNTTYCAYTEYDSDYRGGYTYFIGEEVKAFDDALPEGLQTLTIPQQKYARFTTPAGPMPHVVVDAWQKIWQSKELKRCYQTDFEIYDERASNHEKVVLDIFIGIK